MAGVEITLKLELKFLDLLLTKHPKSSETWTHRRWVVRMLYDNVLRKNDNVGRTEAARIVEREIKVCGDVARVYPKNYYAWTYRAWVLSLSGSDNEASENSRKFLKKSF